MPFTVSFIKYSSIIWKELSNCNPCVACCCVVSWHFGHTNDMLVHVKEWLLYNLNQISFTLWLGKSIHKCQ